jgi:hypothetical protein
MFLRPTAGRHHSRCWWKGSQHGGGRSRRARSSAREWQERRSASCEIRRAHGLRRSAGWVSSSSNSLGQDPKLASLTLARNHLRPQASGDRGRKNVLLGHRRVCPPTIPAMISITRFVTVQVIRQIASRFERRRTVYAGGRSRPQIQLSFHTLQ